jgi:hypothetical protein
VISASPSVNGSKQGYQMGAPKIWAEPGERSNEGIKKDWRLGPVPCALTRTMA